MTFCQVYDVGVRIYEFFVEGPGRRWRQRAYRRGCSVAERERRYGKREKYRDGISDIANLMLVASYAMSDQPGARKNALDNRQ